MADIKITIINETTVLTDDQIKAVIPDLQTQISRDFYLIWGIDADLLFASKTDKPDPKTWWMVLLDNTDDDSALGYHETNTIGLPIGKVFAKTDIQYGDSWSLTLSHELLEIICDPYINLTAAVQRNDGSLLLYSYEVCDACEDDQFGYKINNTLVSDFVTPFWFGSPCENQKYDFMGHIKEPFQLLEGGYTSIFDTRSGSGWQQKTAEKCPLKKLRPASGSRQSRRKLGFNNFLKSTIDKS